jgi:putative SOS response-associated peptidase YedK
MCGRFALTLPDLMKFLQIRNLSVPAGIVSHYNIAPGQKTITVCRKDNYQETVMMKWGLIPAWAEDHRLGYRLINARAETILDKPTYRKPFLTQRCIIPASGFYEWKEASEHKDPYYFYDPGNDPLALAGIYDVWHSPQKETILSFSIITIGASDFMRKYHDRMPLILTTPKDEHSWLWEKDPGVLQKLFRPLQELQSFKVSKLVNKPENDKPELLVPV